MGKFSPKRPMSFKQKRQSRNIKNMYLRPGALAQLRYSRTTIKSCADISKKRVWMFDTDNLKEDLSLTIKVAKHSPSVLSSKITRCRPMVDPMDVVKPKNLSGTPRTPVTADWEFDSRLESLPMDILVKILCHLQHDQLKAVILVSKRITSAVLLAKEWHFNYITPNRSRQEMLRAKKILLNEHGHSVSSGDGKGMWASVPCTPKAPKQGRRLALRINTKEMQQIAADLFHESAFCYRAYDATSLAEPYLQLSGSF
ncbi:F-box protein [Cinnamomum micranthum f. kanehirae]|uniref:F-box protein n=1 Tax=Cinnamomum micranthum f. kanehirae TaxID=337451 RepID=A0A443PNN9_9MAGN|nr:F-box protein [Cinnamomum micranthum f. kanehirae]